MKIIFPDAIQHKKLSELSHDDWLKARQEGIGGSDAAAILGMSKYKSAFNVFLDKKGLSAPVDDNLNMLIGRELEDTVARLFYKETGKHVRKNGKFSGPWATDFDAMAQKNLHQVIAF